MKVDVVVVGSGISGLTAAAILAQSGKKVAIVEKQPNLGGSLRQFKRNRISFDVGFHYTGCVGQGEILNLLWSYCKVMRKLSVVPLGTDGYDSFEFEDLKKPVRGFFSYEKLSEELHSYFPEEKSAIVSYLETIRGICSNVPFYRTDLPLTPFLRGYKSRPSSLARYLNDITRNTYLQAVLTAPGFLYGVPVARASLEVHALVAHGYYSGAYTITGGGQAIVDGFLGSLAELGVELLPGRSMESVLVNGAAVTGVILDDQETIDCKHVIYTGHPATIVDRVPAQVFRPAYRHRLLELRNSLSMFAVFGRGEQALKTGQGPLNYYLIPGRTAILPEYDDTSRQLRPMMMTSTRSGPQDLLQQDPNGIILLRLGYWQDVQQFAGSSPGKRPQKYEEYKNVIATDMIQTAEKRWGELCGRIEPLAIGTPLSFRDELSAPEGCAYGAMHCLDQFNPDVRTRLPGLLLAGQSTLMTGVVGASISGLVAAGEILGLESLWEDIKKWS